MFNFGRNNEPQYASNEGASAMAVLEQPVEGPNKDLILTEQLAQVNSLLKYMTEMDYIKDMLLDVTKQTDMIEGVAASSEEMTASIEDVSDFVQTSSHSAQDSIGMSGQTVERIDLAFKDIEKTFEASQEVQRTMDNVNVEAKKINDMVGIIKGVADQTNLLALNASIEAARAGEHGRGFAVVADEIKKLAENTKEQVSFITEVVNKLTSQIESASEALVASNASFSEGKGEMNDAVTSLDSIKDSLDNISGNFTEISANIEEQTAASQEISSSIMVMNDKAKTIHEGTEKTGMAFNSLSKIVNDMRLGLIEEVDDLDTKTQIELSVTDHLMWRWRVYNMILGFENITVDEVGDHKSCRLGKWCDEMHHASGDDFCAIVDELGTPHKKLHSLAKEAVVAYNSGDMAKAEKSLHEMDDASKEVIAYLGQLKRLNRTRNKG